MAASEELFKMPMRHWLPKMVDSAQFEGLEWIDVSRTVMKIPWTKKGYPGFESCQELVKAWANHQGRNEEEGKKSDFSTLKANFRNAIHKSEDFKEDVNQSQLNNQTGNFKVYKMLSREEVQSIKEEKKREKVRKRKTKQQNNTRSKLVCAEHNFDDGKLKTIDKDDLEFALCSPEESFLNDTTTQADSIQQTFTLFAENMTPHGSRLPTAQFDMNSSPCPQYGFSANHPMPNGEGFYPPYVQSLPPIAAIQCTSDYNMDINPSYQDLSNVVQCTGDATFQYPMAHQCQPLGVADLCNLLRIQYEHLPQCKITVTYNNIIVLRENLENTQKGYRVFHGNETSLKTVLRLHQTSDEGLSDYECPTISLPNAQSEHKVLQEILYKTDLGLVFRYDPDCHSFLVKRLCQSQTFFLDPHAEVENQVPIKMNRQEEVCVFSWQKYLESLANMASTPQSSQCSSPVIYISIGSKSNLHQKNPSPRGIKLEIRPCELSSISDDVLSSANTSLYFSRATPVEEMLRQMKGVSINNN